MILLNYFSFISHIKEKRQQIIKIASYYSIYFQHLMNRLNYSIWDNWIEVATTSITCTLLFSELNNFHLKLVLVIFNKQSLSMKVFVFIIHTTYEIFFCCFLPPNCSEISITSIFKWRVAFQKELLSLSLLSIK